jgi:hypothetical protein
VNFTPEPLTPGILLLNWTIGICGTFFVLASIGWFAFYMNASSRAELYEGAPYRVTTFRVTSVQYYRIATDTLNGGTSSVAAASASGIVEGQRESMDLLPCLNKIPQDQQDVEQQVPAGTVIGVYLFPTLRGENRIQRIGGLPPAEKYQRQATWASSRAFPVVGFMGLLTVFLSLARYSLWRSARRRLAQADCVSR